MTASRLLFLALLLLLISCKPNTPEQESGENTLSEDTSAAPAPSGYYRIFTGQIDKLPITMHLVKERRYQSWDKAFFDNYIGYYYYDRFGEPIDIMGNVDSSGQLRILDFSNPIDAYVFAGTMSGDTLYTGIWTDAEGKKSLPFELRAVEVPGSVLFEQYNFADSLPLRPQDPTSPQASISASFLWPAASLDPDTREFLRKAIIFGMAGDSIDPKYPDAEALYRDMRYSFFEFYKGDMQGLADDTTTIPEDMTYAYSYDRNNSIRVLWNSNNLLSLAFFDYTYTGGAHGMYFSSLNAYDLANRRRYELEDVFAEAGLSGLSGPLEAAFRKKYGLKPKEKLTDHLFVDIIEPTRNFCLTRNGVMFNYVPYEIGPYAAGEITLFLKWDQVKPYLNRNFSIPQ